ncbi:hypothetical protein OF83DRAFT_1165636 [Amylostereum chailletii]|nr:hypothetical protein OF83DRAFT_1165636 [Amylostereum chailletii]
MSPFAEFQKAFKGDLITPDHPQYEDSLIRWAANSRRRAAIVAFVKDAEDASIALQYAKAQGLSIAVRGGGHSPAGASSVEGGLVIDLSRHLAGVRVDPDAKLAYVDGGALWATVNKETMKHGLATTGGTVGHVRYALTLGGGFGYLAGSHGLTIDNLVKATVVIADGSILTASETENTDLFWGIRGGGSNYGVVTEFVLKIHPQRTTVFGGVLVFPPSALEDLMPILIEKDERGLAEKETFLVAITRTQEKDSILLILFWNGTEEEGRAHYKPFYDLNPVADMTKERTYVDMNSILDDGNPVGRNYYLKSVSQPHQDLEIAKRLRDAVHALSVEHNLDVVLGFEFWSLGKINSVPNDATAFQRSWWRTSLVSIQYEEDTPERLAEVRKVANELTGIVTSMTKDDHGINGYANYNSDAPGASLDIHAPDEVMSTLKTKALFGENHVRLQQLKRKYDPDLVFNKWFAIRPAEVTSA